MSQNEIYLRLGGWIMDRGCWHPPSCLASWPEEEAVAMAKKDEATGRRMSRDGLLEYLHSIHIHDPVGYVALCESALSQAAVLTR